MRPAAKYTAALVLAMPLSILGYASCGAMAFEIPPEEPFPEAGPPPPRLVRREAGGPESMEVRREAGGPESMEVRGEAGAAVANELGREASETGVARARQAVVAVAPR